MYVVISFSDNAQYIIFGRPHCNLLRPNSLKLTSRIINEPANRTVAKLHTHLSQRSLLVLRAV
jgi:hypothetical protein